MALIKRSFKTLRGRKILITGAAGFIGSHLLRRVMAEGPRAAVFIRPGSDTFRIRDLLSALHVYRGDLADYDSVSACVADFKPSVIFHLGGSRDTRRDFSLIDSIIRVNLGGTVNLFKAIIESRIRLDSFVNFGTCEEYGDNLAPFREDLKEIPVSPYSLSKIMTSHFCTLMNRMSGLPVVNLRPFLTYGPAQDVDMFIPSLIHHALTGQDFPMTAGTQTREVNYVGDIAEAALLAATTFSAIGRTINIGNGKEYQIRALARKILRMMGDPIKLRPGALPQRFGEASHFYSDSSVAREILQWEPKVALEEGLSTTIEWYRSRYLRANGKTGT